MSSETVPESFFVHSDTEIIYVDPAFQTLIGAESQEKLVGKPLTEVITPEYHAPFRKQAERIENEDVPDLGMNYRSLLRSGDPRSLRRAVSTSPRNFAIP